MFLNDGSAARPLFATAFLIALTLTCAAHARAQSDAATSAPNDKSMSSPREAEVKSPASVPDATSPGAADAQSGGGQSDSGAKSGGTQSASSKAAGLIRGAKARERNFPERSSRLAIGLGTKYVNAVLRGMRQGAGFPFGVELTTADAIPGVEFRLTAQTSTKLYHLLEAEAYVPRVFDDKTHADVWFDYTRRKEDDFFGIGPRIPRTFETNYSLEQRSFNAGLFRDFDERTQAGVYTRVSNGRAFRGEDDSLPSINTFFSGSPAAPRTRFLPGLDTTAEILSYGAYALFDGRDQSRGLTRGAYLYGRLASNDGLDRRAQFDDYGWFETEFDARGYVPLGGDRASLALRTYALLNDPKGNSQMPFYEMSFLGGRAHVRGYDNYRYFGENLLMFTVEPRATVWKKDERRGADVFVFGDAGQVWGDSRSLTDPTVLRNDKFSSSNWRASAGAGAQYRFSRDFAFRLEFARSNEATKLYFSFSRGF